MRDVLVIVGFMLFAAFTAATVSSFLGRSSGDATNGVVLAAAAGFGLGLALARLIKGDRA